MDNRIIDWKKYFDKIICVHYLSYNDRLFFLKQELHRVGITDDILEFSYTYNTPYVDILHAVFKNSDATNCINTAAVSCALGHYNAIKIAYENNCKKVLIIEDDIAFLKNIEQIKETLDNVPDDADVVLFDKFIHFDTDTYNKMVKDNSVNKYFTKFNNEDIASACCYMLSRKAQCDFIKIYEKYLMVADICFTQYESSHKYFANNNIAIQNQYDYCMNYRYYGTESMNSGYKPINIKYEDYNLYDFKPLVSIIVPCYNYGKYVKDAISSIKKQTYDNYECIIIDDGSTDNSAEIIKAEIKDYKNFKYVYQNNAGAANARNNAINMSSGKYIICVDADDIIYCDYIKNAVAYMEKHNECVLFYGKANYLFDNGTTECWDLKEPQTYKELLYVNSIYSTAVIRKSEYNKTNGFDENMKGYEDWEFLIRLLYNNFHIHQDNNTNALLYRKHGSSKNTEAEHNMMNLITYIYNKNKDIYNENNIKLK